jgi:predicted outer membrane repeat protein
MQTKPYSLNPALMACVAMLAAMSARAVEFHVATAQDLQTALTTAAGNGAANNIWLTNGYYTGTFNYSSSANYNLSIQPELGVASTNVTIDGLAGGRDLNITCTGSSGNVTVSNITFVRNCGSSSIGSLRIAGSGGGTMLVEGCRFLSLTNSLGMGLEIASGLNTTVTNCIVLGKTNGSVSDGDGINISGVTGATLICGSTMAGNYAGNGADITASAVLTVTNNVFQSNNEDGLYFSPGGSKTAAVVVSNNVFNSNGLNSSYWGMSINNFGTINVGANIFSGNRGGGAYAANGLTATIAGNTFNGNGYYNGYWGGAYVASVTTSIVTGNTFSGNSGGYGGGGLSVSSFATANVTGNTFTGNSMDDGSGGGAVCVQGGGSGSTASISNNTFSANTVYGPGGAVSFNGNSGTNLLTGNTFTGNSCSGNNAGGAAYFSGGTSIIASNTFLQNSGPDGGGAIYATGPTITMVDNLVANNSQSGSSASGGGIFVNASTTLYMVNNTIFGNSSAGNGGGVSFQVSGTVELLNVFNNIIWGNSLSGAGNGSDVYLTGSGQTKLFMYNDANGMYGVWNNAAPLLNVDPQFFNPVNGDFHFPSTSPCANYGTNGPFLAPTDLDGNIRTNSAGQVDLGCYEFNNTATHPADTNGDFVISAAEYTAYAAAWKAGLSWSNGPNPIPANYVTRAGYLMTNGGTYYNDGSARPVNWKP